MEEKTSQKDGADEEDMKKSNERTQPEGCVLL